MVPRSFKACMPYAVAHEPASSTPANGGGLAEDPFDGAQACGGARPGALVGLCQAGPRRCFGHLAIGDALRLILERDAAVGGHLACLFVLGLVGLGP